MDIIIYFACFFIGLLGGFYACVFHYKTHLKVLAETKDELDSLKSTFTDLQEKTSTLKADNAALNAEKSKDLEAGKLMQTSFENMARKIMEDNSSKFSHHNQEKIDALLLPLKEKITDFEKKITNSHEADISARSRLLTEIEKLTQLNQKVSQDAINLTNALKSQSKTQGDWGEMVLERILEASGLQKSLHYEKQRKINRPDGSWFLLDVLIKLPEDKNIIIDAKVSLSDYVSYNSTADNPLKAKFCKAHLNSVAKHVKELSDKSYYSSPELKTPDFVLMFIPVEGAFALAMQTNPSLYIEALEKNVVIVTATTLLATLRTIKYIWQQDAQNRNAREIAERGGRLYDKFVNFISDLEKVGDRVRQTQNAYDNAYNKLCSGSGNLVRQVEQLRTLGAKADKSLSKAMLEDAQEELIDSSSHLEKKLKLNNEKSESDQDKLNS